MHVENLQPWAGPSPQHCAKVEASARPVLLVGGAAVTALAVVLFFFHLGTYGLWEPDEARYAEIAREMLASRDFIVPHLNWVAYIEKPPLLYWLTAVSMKLFGVNEFAARLVNAMAALTGVLATYYFVARTFDSRRAVLAGVVLATSPLYGVMAQVLTTDMLLMAATTIAMFAFFLQWREGGRWWWLCYFAIGAAVLSKGPVGAVLPMIAGAVFLALEGQLHGALRRFCLLPGFFIAAAVTLPWFIAIMIREPDFFNFYFIGENLRRFLQPRYSHGEPVYYYIPIALGGFVPWSLAMPVIPWRSLEPNDARRFCLIAGSTVFILFSLASAKLIPYILPAFPFAAIVAADGLMAFAEADEGGSVNRRVDTRRLASVTIFLILAGFAVLAIAANAPRLKSPYPTLLQPVLFASGATIIVFAAASSAAFWAHRFAAGMTLLIGGAAAMLMTISYGRIRIESTRSYAALARSIERLAPDARLICYPRYIESLPFYCRKRIILVGAKTELTYGADHAPDASGFFFTRREDLFRLWTEPQASVLVIDRGALAPIQNRLGTYRVIASDSKKLALMRVRSGEKGAEAESTYNGK
jgi:4-amino-4-deoxy-L-arabinose transferase-like glycosyltransferase